MKDIIRNPFAGLFQKASSSKVHATVNESTDSDAGEVLDQKLVETFCSVFGAQYRNQLTPETDMDAIEEWDSESFLNLVFALEDAFGLTFTDTEAAQMFQLGHIERIVRNAQLDLPHDDVSHACCQLKLLNMAPDDQMNMVLLSGSSTREGFLEPAMSRAILQQKTGRDNVGWFNMSVSGLVAAETLQLIEAIKILNNGILVIGFSPIILAGCGEAEYWRAVKHQRFPFAAAKMDKILSDNGYKVGSEDIQPSMSVDLWAERYLKGRSLEELQYEPYLYPTLAPWDRDKYQDEKSILQFYNNAILNFEQSIKINKILFRTMAEYCRSKNIPVVLINLTLHSEMLTYLERLGGIVEKSNLFVDELRRDYGMPFVDSVKAAGITDDDFRDPAHIYRKRDIYTEASIDGVLSAASPL